MNTHRCSSTRLAALLISSALLLTACGGGGGSGDSGLPQPLGDIAQPVTPAVADAPFAKALGDCTFNPRRNTACQLTELPFLGQEATTVSVEQIMGRVAVTHPWMATRFSEMLATQPAELLQMMRSVTAVIIGSKVRPSFYFPSTGAIYLDPESLWLTQAERATIDMTPDERIGFGGDLQFRAIWRYVKDNDYAYDFYPASFSGSRTIDDIRIPMGRLLAHELAHAGDFMPPSSLATLPRNQTVEAAISSQQSQWISEKLKRNQPLTSTTWMSLAQVLFANRTPTNEERSYTPAQAGQLIEPDRAADAYGYFTQYEDLAMLTEELLSYCFYGVQRDFATSNRPTSGDFVVGWGMRGRVGVSAVNQAARFAIAELLPNANFSSCYASLPAPVRLRSGATWTANLDPAGGSTTTATGAKSAAAIRPDDLLPPG